MRLWILNPHAVFAVFVPQQCSFCRMLPSMQFRNSGEGGVATQFNYFCVSFSIRSSELWIERSPWQCWILCEPWCLIGFTELLPYGFTHHSRLSGFRNVADVAALAVSQKKGEIKQSVNASVLCRSRIIQYKALQLVTEGGVPAQVKRISNSVFFSSSIHPYLLSGSKVQLIPHLKFKICTRCK